MKNLKILGVAALSLTLLLSACGKNDAKTEEKANGANATNQAEQTADGQKKDLVPISEDNKIVIGVSATPHGEIIEGLKPEFEKEGLDVEVVNFDDYIQPNLHL